MISSRGIVNQEAGEAIVCINDLILCIEPGCELSSDRLVSADKIKSAVYKSLLQKAIRRMNLEEGLRACVWLWNNDQTSLFRRLPIISVEDGYYNPDDNHMWVWMMLLNSKGYFISGEDLKKRMLESVKRLILHPCYSRKRETARGENRPELTFPLRIRRQYGGMTGDMSMLDKFIEEYNPNGNYKNIPLAKPFSGKLYEACDFHVFPWLVRENDMKSVFWKYRSGINLRDRDSMTDPPPRLENMLKEYDSKCISLYNQYL